jgi:hypothetical protein
MALPLNTRTALGSLGLAKRTLGACTFALLCGPLLGLVLLLLFLLLLLIPAPFACSSVICIGEGKF